MLKLVFAEVGLGPTVELGPYPQVRIDGETLRAERGGPVLAQHLPHSWRVKGRDLFRLDCETLVRLHFENEKGERGVVARGLDADRGEAADREAGAREAGFCVDAQRRQTRRLVGFGKNGHGLALGQ